MITFANELCTVALATGYGTWKFTFNDHYIFLILLIY